MHPNDNNIDLEMSMTVLIIILEAVVDHAHLCLIIIHRLLLCRTFSIVDNQYRHIIVLDHQNYLELYLVLSIFYHTPLILLCLVVVESKVVHLNL